MLLLTIFQYVHIVHLLLYDFKSAVLLLGSQVHELRSVIHTDTKDNVYFRLCIQARGNERNRDSH